MAKYRGTGKITSADYKSVKWIGMDKGGKAVTIELKRALNMGNIDWTFADKDDTVAEITFTAVYGNTDAASTDTTEPWTIEIEGTAEGASEILLGAGVLQVDDKTIALSRGGGKFSVEREYRNISADGDRGPVEGRIVMDGSTATLTMSVLTMLTKFTDLYSAIETVAEV